jgi:hypothetical protein
VEEHIRLCILSCHHHPLPQQPELHSLRYYAVGDEVPLGRFVRTLLRQLVQEDLLKSGPEFPVLADWPKQGQRLHPAQLVELPLPRPHRRCIHAPRTSSPRRPDLGGPDPPRAIFRSDFLWFANKPK